jgi:hypothetical protein
VIGDEVDVFHHAMRSEQILETEFRSFEGKVSDEKFVVHDTNLLGLTGCSLDCSRPPGFKSSLNRVHFEIHHVLESQSRLRRGKTATVISQIKRELGNGLLRDSQGPERRKSQNSR